MAKQKITPMTPEQRRGRVALYLAENGMTQQDLAKALGCGPGMMSMLISGYSNKRSRALEKSLARKMSVPVDKLFGPAARPGAPKTKK